MKRLTDYLAALGISFINPHLTLYSMRGERKRDYPPNISWMQPWFDAARGYFDHIARVCELMSEGECETDLLAAPPDRQCVVGDVPAAQNESYIQHLVAGGHLCPTELSDRNRDGGKAVF